MEHKMELHDCNHMACTRYFGDILSIYEETPIFGFWLQPPTTPRAPMVNLW